MCAVMHTFVGIFGVHGLATALFLVSCCTRDVELHGTPFLRLSAISNSMINKFEGGTGTEYRKLTEATSEIGTYECTFSSEK